MVRLNIWCLRNNSLKNKFVGILIFCVFALGISSFIYHIYNVPHNECFRTVQTLYDYGSSVLYDFEYDFSQKNNRIENYIKPKPPTKLTRLLYGKHVLGHVVYAQIDIAFGDIESFLAIDLSPLQHLQHLHLSGCGVDSRVIPKLFMIKSLKSLDLCNTSLSMQEIDLIQSKLPECNIVVCPCPYPTGDRRPENGDGDTKTGGK